MLSAFYYLLWNASKDFILRILIVAGIVSLILGVAFGERKEIGKYKWRHKPAVKMADDIDAIWVFYRPVAEWIEGAAILLAVVIVMLVTAGNDWLKERQFAALMQTEQKFCSCRRSSLLRELPVESLLVGDIILVEAGDEIPAVRTDFGLFCDSR